MDCSVVITTYNRAKLLADTLLSLADQQVSPAVRWEVIVVDNNSRDETEDVVRRCSETTSLRIRHVFEPRQGQSFARNRGIEAAEGAVILFTDDDIIPNPDWVSAMLRAIDADDCEGAGGKVLPLWEGEVPSWLSGRSDLLSWLALVDSDEACMLDYPLVASRRIVGASMGFRRSVFQEFGRFPTNLGHRGRRMYGGEEVRTHQSDPAQRATDPLRPVHRRASSDRAGPADPVLLPSATLRSRVRTGPVPGPRGRGNFSRSGCPAE